jgi:hypothetical protein
MTQETIKYEGAFTLDTRTSINNNFTELYTAFNPPVSVTASTLTADAATYAGKNVVLNRAAGIAVTLPAATGSGYSYTFFIGTTISSNSTTIKVANSSDIIGGVATMGSSGGTSASVGTASTSDTITFNGTTTGGIAGTRIELTDIAANLWNVEVHGVASGVALTPFSATV